jgi:hypothetical protein
MGVIQDELIDGLNEVEEERIGDVEGLPAERAPAAVVEEVGDGDADHEVLAVLVFIYVERRGGGDVGLEPVDEDEEAGVSGAEVLLPGDEAVEVVEVDPVFPEDLALARGAGETLALDVDDEVGACGGMDEEVEVFDASDGVGGAGELSDGDEGDTVIGQKAPEGLLVMSMVPGGHSESRVSKTTGYYTAGRGTGKG